MAQFGAFIGAGLFDTNLLISKTNSFRVTEGTLTSSLEKLDWHFDIQTKLVTESLHFNLTFLCEFFDAFTKNSY